MAVDTDVRTLYVANLDRNVSEEILYELFMQAGPVERVNIPTNNNDSSRYGFITYKHECAIEYAIELYKGTCLFQREIVIKKKGDRSNQQSNGPGRYGESYDNGDPNQGLMANSGQPDFAQMLLLSQQLFHAQNGPNFNVNHSNHPSHRNDHLNQSSLKGHWSNRPRPYDRDSRNYSTRSREPRNRHKDRDFNNKSYRDRKGRY